MYKYRSDIDFFTISLWKLLSYFCTFYNNYSGITQASVTIVAKNNISSAVTSDNYSGSFDAASDYNTSSDTTAPGTHSQKSVALASMKFSSTASGSENLHIVKTSIAVNKATDLSVDPNLPITDDADGESRLALDPSAWSIGADQYYPTYEATLGVGGTSVTPIAWYKFDEGVGSTA